MAEEEHEFALTETQLECFRNVFAMFDKEGNGLCSWSEDFAAMFRAVNQNPTQKEVEEIIALYDKDGSDKFTMDQWLRVMDSPKAKDFMKPEDVIEAFRQFDKDGTGLIKVPMMRYVAQAIGDKLDPDSADEFLDFCVSQGDKEKTGEIDYEAVVKALFERDYGVSASL